MFGSRRAPVAHLDQRVRLFRTGAEDAARPVIFERAADQPHAIGQQRRGQRVARVPGIAAAVEGEIEAARPIDDAADGKAERLPLRNMARVTAGLRSGFASATLSISCLRVSRTTTEPGAAAAGVIPELGHGACLIVAQIDVVEERGLGIGAAGSGRFRSGIAEIGELARRRAHRNTDN